MYRYVHVYAYIYMVYYCIIVSAWLLSMYNYIIHVCMYIVVHVYQLCRYMIHIPIHHGYVLYIYVYACMCVSICMLYSNHIISPDRLSWTQYDDCVSYVCPYCIGVQYTGSVISLLSLMYWCRYMCICCVSIYMYVWYDHIMHVRIMWFPCTADNISYILPLLWWCYHGESCIYVYVWQGGIMIA